MTSDPELSELLDRTLLTYRYHGMREVGQLLQAFNVHVYACCIMPTPFNEFAFHLTESLSEEFKAHIAGLGAEVCDFRQDPKGALKYWSEQLEHCPEDRRADLKPKVEKIRALAEGHGL